MIIVFDGVCNLCNGWVRFLLARDPGGRFRFAATQSQAGARILTECGEPPDDPSTFVLVDGDQRYFRSDAILRVLGSLGGLWRAVGVFRIVPRALRDWAYTILAQRRYRWFGKMDVCPVPPPEMAGRFLS